MLANLATGSFMVTALTNTAYLARWWHMKGKRQSLCGKTCWLTTIPAHTGKATRTEMSTDNEATHARVHMHAHVHTLLFPHRYNLRQPRITPSSHTNTQIPNPQFCVYANLYTFIRPFTHGPSAHLLSVPGYKDEENSHGPCSHRASSQAHEPLASQTISVFQILSCSVEDRAKSNYGR